MEQVNNHSKSKTNWKIQDDLYLLKNYKEDKVVEIGEHLQRTNNAVASRWWRLSNSPNRIKEIRRSFPEAQVQEPEVKKRVIPAKNENSIKGAKRTWYSRQKDRKNSSYTMEDFLYLANNITKSDTALGLKMGRTPGAISVLKTKIRRALLDHSSEIYKAYTQQQKMSELGSVLINKARKEPEVRTKQIQAADKQFIMPYRDIKIDYVSKQIIFILD